MQLFCCTLLCCGYNVTDIHIHSDGILNIKKSIIANFPYRVKLLYNIVKFITNITYAIATAAAEGKSDLKSATDIHCLTPRGKLWGVYSEDLEENWVHINGIILYIVYDCTI